MTSKRKAKQKHHHGRKSALGNGMKKQRRRKQLATAALRDLADPFADPALALLSSMAMRTRGRSRVK